MASSISTTSPFIAKLLAPLPSAAALKLSRSQAEDGLDRMWRRAQLRVWITQHARSAAAYSKILSREFGTDCLADAEAAETAADADLHEAIDALMRLPAPRIGGLRWKQKSREFKGGHPGWDAAIARDEARFASLAKAGGRA